tara:strand:+ start:10682 stop:10891 length:210 start_codon:yes stop_codon:yes gene_type:complete
MITEKDIIMDNIYETIQLGDWLGDICDDEVKRKDVIHYMMEDFSLDKPTAEQLLEMFYLNNIDLEPSWK